MRIGLDASLLGGRGGIAAYTEGLLGGLSRVAAGHALVLWCGRRGADAAARRLALPATSTVVTPGPAGRLLGWAGRLPVGHPVPIEALAGPVDVFHGLNYFLPARRGRAALVVTVHDLSALRHPQWHPPTRSLMHQTGVPRTLQAADHVITDSEAIRAEAIAHLGALPERVTVIHLAASPAFRPHTPAELKPILDRWSLAPGGYLLFAGTIEPRKNIERLLEAVAALRGRRRHLPPLILVGPRGWRNRAIHAPIAAAAPHARYLGYVPPEELAALMAGTVAFVFPSLYEGFGLPVLEAMASGAPVVTSRGGALEEAAGGAALVVDPLDPETIAAGIEGVLDDATVRGELISRGLARAAQFSWDRTARETLQVYENAITSRNG